MCVNLNKMLHFCVAPYVSKNKPYDFRSYKIRFLGNRDILDSSISDICSSLCLILHYGWQSARYECINNSSLPYHIRPFMVFSFQLWLYVVDYTLMVTYLSQSDLWLTWSWCNIILIIFLIFFHYLEFNFLEKMKWFARRPDEPSSAKPADLVM